MTSHFYQFSAVALLCWLAPQAARANGRMPGANDLAFNPGMPGHVAARATFGVVQSGDAGKSWSWICEQAIDISGVIADPPLALLQDGTLVLLPPTGSALVSNDGGCSWQRAAALKGKRGVDLTLDPGNPARLLAITSTLSSVNSQGFGAYENLVAETQDNAQTFQTLATLPADFDAETIEVAKSDTQRIYVSGTATADPRQGVIFRSDDGGKAWVKTTFALPAGTGSLFISAIHPTDPDRLWVRVPARGDTIGLLPARLYVSTDKGATFQMLAATTKAMFGFALSPDGSELAYGGPSDGLYVGPSDGSGAYEKRSALGVRCLRWLDNGALYACASEPADPFSVGVSDDAGRNFRSLYRLVDTCPAACAADSGFANSCQTAWGQTRPFIQASAAMCSVPWAQPIEVAVDASAGTAGGVQDAEAETDPSAPGDAAAGAAATVEVSPDAEAKAAGTGCACAVGPGQGAGSSAGGLWAVFGLAVAFRRGFIARAAACFEQHRKRGKPKREGPT